MQEFDAVFWDIGGVILDMESVEEARAAFVGALAERYDLDEAAALETWREELGAYFAEREGTEYDPAREGYARAVEAVVGRAVPESEWRPLLVEASERALRPVEGAPATIRRLSAAGYRLAVVSDIDTWEAERILADFGVREAFDAVVTSEDVGRRKPDPAMFEAAIDAVGVDPSRALLVGDRYDHDMRGASRTGLSTVTLADAPAAESLEPDEGFRVADPAVDFVVPSPPALLELLGVEDGE